MILATLQRFKGRFRQQDTLAHLAWGAGIAFVILVAGAVLSYVAQVLLARWLGSAEYGAYTYAVSWGSVLAIIAGLGFPIAVLRFIPEYSTKGDWARASGLVRSSWRLNFFAGLALSALGMAALWLTAPANSERPVTLLLGIWMVPLLALVRLQQEMSRAIGKVAQAYVPSMVLQPVLVIAGAYLLTQTSHRLASGPAVATYILANVAVVLIQLQLFRQAAPPDIFQSRPIYETGMWLRVALPMIVITGSVILIRQADIILLGTFLSPSEVGPYGAASKTASIVVFIVTSVNTIAAPSIASLYTKGDQKGLQRLVSTAVHLTFWPTFGIALFLIVFGDFVLEIFGPEFVAARLELTLLVLGTLVKAGSGSAGYLMHLTGYQVQSAKIFGWSTVATIVLNAALIPWLGTVGAALATLLATVLLSAWLQIWVARNLGMQTFILFAPLPKVGAQVERRR